eukprot:9470870-Pyramimonas_sp.AAC.3
MSALLTLNEAQLSDDWHGAPDMCARCGRVRCPHCKATGIQNNWLFAPAREGERGWGPRGEP